MEGFRKAAPGGIRGQAFRRFDGKTHAAHFALDARPPLA